MMKEIARALLIHVYHPVSAVVSLDGIGGVMDVFLFDTKFAGARIKVHECAKEVVLITNHPEGSMLLYEEDLENIARLKEQIPFTPLRIWITGEDIGLREITL